MFRAGSTPGPPPTIELAGDIDIASVPGVRRRIARAIDDGYVDLLVDLAAVTFMDAALVGVLVAGRRACRRRGGSLRVSRISIQARSVLQLARLESLLQPTPRSDEAPSAVSLDQGTLAGSTLGEEPIEVRIAYAGETYSGFVTARRQRAGQWEALVVFFAFAANEPMPRRLDTWIPFGQLRLA